MTVDDEWGYSAGFLSALASLVRELEQKEIAVYEVAYSYLSFGSGAQSSAPDIAACDSILTGKKLSFVLPKLGSVTPDLWQIGNHFQLRH